MNKSASTKTPIVLVISATLGGLLLFAIFILLAGVGREDLEDSFERQQAKNRLAIHDRLLKDDLKKLGTVGWANEKQEVAHVPIKWGIERAMSELAKKPVSASEVAVPPPMPAQPPQVDTAEDSAETEETGAEGEAAAEGEQDASGTAGEEDSASKSGQEEASSDSSQ